MQMIFTHTKKLALKLAFVFSLLVSFTANISIAAAQASNNANLNETQKHFFQEAKKMSSDDQNTLTSVLMIVAVIAVVILAMYLAFKKDGSEKKRTFARTPKKEF
jgi:hypothetical protein